jgi:uncharacterized protein YaeQ
MTGAATTLQFRLVLSAVDRGVDLSTKLVVPRREDETMTHVVLRVLAFCLYYRAEQPDGGALRLAPGPADRDGPDLWAHDFGGRPTEWIICGAPDVEELRYVFQHQRQAKIRILVSSSEERDRFLGALRTFRRTLPGLGGVDLRQVDEMLLQTLGARDEERQRWMVTVVDGHVYVDADGVTADGEVVPIAIPVEEVTRA